MLELQQDSWRCPLEIKTHRKIEHRWSGRPREVSRGFALVTLETVPPMAADDSGLVHGGFTFSAADHAAMLAVNHPLAVLGEARVRYLEPVWLGESVDFKARVTSREGRRVEVLVEAETDRVVLRGEFTCFILDESLEALKGK